MSLGLIGKKVGMTQIFADNGDVVPVTVIEVGPCTVLEYKTPEKNGYTAVKVGYDEVKEGKLNKPEEGVFKKKNLKPHRIVKEFRVQDGDYKEGDLIKADIFSENDFVDVSGVTIGRGTQGTMKRYGFGGNAMSHGHHGGREPGSIGQHTYPGRVIKGKRMSGRMGNVKRTIQNLRVVKIMADDNLLMVRGAVPGKAKSLVVITKAAKKRNVKKTTAKK